MERVNDSAVVLLPLNSIETEAQQQILNTARRLAGALTKRGRTAALLRLIGEVGCGSRAHDERDGTRIVSSVPWIDGEQRRFEPCALRRPSRDDTAHDREVRNAMLDNRTRSGCKRLACRRSRSYHPISRRT